MKRLSLIILIIAFALSSCTAQDSGNIDRDQQRAIQDLVNAKEEFVNTVNLEEYLKLLDPKDLELQTEQANWLKDIKENPIDGYSLELLQLERVDDDTFRARLRQQYKRDDKKYELDFYNKYKLVHGNLYDEGNYFEELQKGNVAVKYTIENKRLAEEVIDDMNVLYDENIERWGITPKRPLVVKMFEDIEELRQSIKLSMWQCAGWYEYGESVKMLVDQNTASKDRIKRVVNHEMTHLFTVEKASGNLAYWLSEGLASYYEVPENQKSPGELYKSMNVRLLSIEELEAIELEKLENRQEISDYYSNAHLITAFLIERYGEDKINRLLEALSKYPARQGATSENDVYYKEYLYEVMPKVLEIEDYQVFKEEWEQQINML